MSHSIMASARQLVAAAVQKLNQLREELAIPEANHTWSKARMFAQEASDMLGRGVARYDGQPHACPACQWTNVNLVNYGEADQPLWRCHGCAGRALRDYDRAATATTLALSALECARNYNAAVGVNLDTATEEARRAVGEAPRPPVQTRPERD